MGAQLKHDGIDCMTRALAACRAQDGLIRVLREREDYLERRVQKCEERMRTVLSRAGAADVLSDVDGVRRELIAARGELDKCREHLCKVHEMLFGVVEHTFGKYFGS